MSIPPELKNVSKAYNKIAEQWSGDRHTSSVSKLVINFASKVIPGGHILDIGCGTGYPIDTYLVHQGFRVTGIDITENLLNKAIERNLPDAQFLLCDFFDYAPSEKFDGLIAFDSFFHFPKERQHEIYPRISRWLKPGAVVLFTHGLNEGEITGTMYGETFYYSCLDVNKVLILMKQSGFEILEYLEYYVEGDMDRDLLILARKI